MAVEDKAEVGMNRRGFFSLLAGSAAVVGFETTFGLDARPRDFLKKGHLSVDTPMLLGDFVMDLRPGAINRVPPNSFYMLATGGIVFDSGILPK